MFNKLYQLLRPLVFLIDPERAHGIVVFLLKLIPFRLLTGGIATSPRLRITIWGRDFANPVGLAAGFDKKAAIIGKVFDLGFGFVEAGTVTIKPQIGNPKPRIFRDPVNRAVINRMGFPGGGVEIFKRNLREFLGDVSRSQGVSSQGISSQGVSKGVLGVNIGMNKDQTDPASDYLQLLKELGNLADYLTINISSPNTPGLRNLQEREPLKELLTAILEARARMFKNLHLPILVKLAPDLNDDQLREIAEVLMGLKIDGVILTNTTLDRPDTLSPQFAAEKGGLSGAPLKQKSTQMIAKFYQLTNGQIPIIGVGGIETAQDAFEKICAGASLVQIYTGMIYQGPLIARDICRGLDEILKSHGFADIREAIGSDHRPAKGKIDTIDALYGGQPTQDAQATQQTPPYHANVKDHAQIVG